MMPNNVQARLSAFPSHIAVEIPSGGFGMVQPGASGYRPIAKASTIGHADEIVTEAFGVRKPTDAEREAALAGSMFGWDLPGADPSRYQGVPARAAAEH